VVFLFTDCGHGSRLNLEARWTYTVLDVQQGGTKSTWYLASLYQAVPAKSGIRIGIRVLTVTTVFQNPW
jgi:hypothetical protein